MMFDNCNECPHHNSNSCPFASRTESHKRSVCQLLRLGLKPVNDGPKEPKDCLKCPRRGTSKCAFLNRGYNEKCRCLWVLSEGHTDYNVDLMAQRLVERLEAIIDMQDSEKTARPPQQEIDYSRNDSQEIVNSMRPYNN